MRSALVYLSLLTCFTSATSQWLKDEDNDALDSVWQNDSSTYSVCPKVEHCYCYNTGSSDVIANCHDAELDFVPQDLPENLTSLEIAFTSVTALPSNSFTNYPNLKELLIYGNSIYDIQNGVLNQLSLLEKLHLHSNNMTSLPVNLLDPCPNLVEIDLSRNELTTLPNIPNLQELMTLDISQNALASLGSSLFSKAPNLHRLDLHGNQISSISSDTFSGLQKLAILYLSENELSALPQGLFSSLQSAEWIELSSNLLTSLAANQFSGPGESLIRLFLKNNHLSDIHNDAFNNLPELDELYLDDNELTDVPEAVKKLPLLDYLSLSANPIVTIKDRAFDGITELNEVTLSNMPSLLDIHVDAFAANREIQLIRLTNNPNLTEFTPQHLPDEDHPLLRVLYLSGNGFTFMDEDLFMTKTALERVDLQGNPFHCDCKLQWMAQVVTDDVPWASHWRQTGSAPRCGTPVHIQGFMISTMLPQDLSCQDVTITSLTEDPLVVHLHSTATIVVMLENGLPASKWRTPDGQEYFPLRTPPYMLKTTLPLRILQNSQRPLVTEDYTAEHQVIAVLKYNNATADVAGVHRVTGQNGNGERYMDISLEVLPYELTLPPPTVGAATIVKGRLSCTAVFALFCRYCFGG